MADVDTQHRDDLQPLYRSGYQRIADALDSENDLFIASEFIFSSDVSGNLLSAPPARTKMGRLIQQHFEQFPTNGFAWIGCSRSMAHAINLIRSNLEGLASERKAEKIRELVEESDPAYFASIDI